MTVYKPLFLNELLNPTPSLVNKWQQIRYFR